MGYPSEIPNAIPPRGEPPVRGALGRWLDRLAALRAWFTRRPRRRADDPARFGQGVDPTLPPLQPGDRARIDFERISRGSR